MNSMQLCEKTHEKKTTEQFKNRDDCTDRFFLQYFFALCQRIAEKNKTKENSMNDGKLKRFLFIFSPFLIPLSNVWNIFWPYRWRINRFKVKNTKLKVIPIHRIHSICMLLREYNIPFEFNQKKNKNANSLIMARGPMDGKLDVNFTLWILAFDSQN